ncbi:hypothetical protein JQC92_09135 [Shewanella sp. 202IG2-18]|uniref:hypothetical protein n=1 Tax=Parashewanella hymeniacidonis TaxID=2807618 RepID=UPI0019621559|nr:hypothetical protein [Parashewanella hymeniacidonis]MBM7072189.1 hypothetical protein [Parashewanella hymeniacidonis]
MKFHHQNGTEADAKQTDESFYFKITDDGKIIGEQWTYFPPVYTQNVKANSLATRFAETRKGTQIKANAVEKKLNLAYLPVNAHVHIMYRGVDFNLSRLSNGTYQGQAELQPGKYYFFIEGQKGDEFKWGIEGYQKQLGVGAGQEVSLVKEQKPIEKRSIEENSNISAFGVEVIDKATCRFNVKYFESGKMTVEVTQS